MRFLPIIWALLLVSSPSLANWNGAPFQAGRNGTASWTYTATGVTSPILSVGGCAAVLVGHDDGTGGTGDVEYCADDTCAKTEAGPVLSGDAILDSDQDSPVQGFLRVVTDGNPTGTATVTIKCLSRAGSSSGIASQGVSDHGELSGLIDDDHSQYTKSGLIFRSSENSGTIVDPTDIGFCYRISDLENNSNVFVATDALTRWVPTREYTVTGFGIGIYDSAPTTTQGAQVCLQHYTDTTTTAAASVCHDWGGSTLDALQDSAWKAVGWSLDQGDAIRVCVQDVTTGECPNGTGCAFSGAPRINIEVFGLATDATQR